MKTYILTLLFILTLVSCQKEEEAAAPIEYHLNFELLHQNGGSYNNGEVEITGNLGGRTLESLANGGFPFISLGKIHADYTQSQSKTLFGIPCFGTSSCYSDFIGLPFATGAEGRDTGAHEMWEKDGYWLMRYPNADIDTLRVHDVRTNDPYTRTFTFFFNGQPLEATEIAPAEYAVTIRK